MCVIWAFAISPPPSLPYYDYVRNANFGKKRAYSFLQWLVLHRVRGFWIDLFLTPERPTQLVFCSPARLSRTGGMADEVLLFVEGEGGRFAGRPPLVTTLFPGGGGGNKLSREQQRNIYLTCCHAKGVLL